jgi:hypothetical protein
MVNAIDCYPEGADLDFRVVHACISRIKEVEEMEKTNLSRNSAEKRGLIISTKEGLSLPRKK